jgi:hypothetical protein
MKFKTKWVYFVMSAVLLLGLVGLVGLFAGCANGNGPDDGTFTVRIVNAGVQNGEFFLLAVFVAGADPLGAGDEPIAVGGDFIAGGTAEGLAYDFATETMVVKFAGGDKYDVYGIVDLNFDEGPDTGEPYGTKLGVEVDGDMVVELDYATFVPIP